MEIVVLSRKNARAFICGEPWAAISITSNPHVWPELSEKNRVGVLQLYFEDRTTPGDKSMTQEHADQILEFIRGVWEKIGVLMVHCDAGLSRSPAVAAAIARIFMGEGEDAVYFQRFWPNYHVYKMLLETHFGKIVPLQPQRAEEVSDEPWDCCG